MAHVRERVKKGPRSIALMEYGKELEGNMVGLVIPTCSSALLSFFHPPFSNLAPHGAKSMCEHFDAIRVLAYFPPTSDVLEVHMGRNQDNPHSTYSVVPSYSA